MGRRGFTIIELLVVIAIIGTLVAAAGIGINNARMSGRDAERITDLSLLAKAVEASAAAHGAYPALAGGRAAGCAKNISSLDLSGFTGKAIPADPSPLDASAGCTDYRSGYIYHTQNGSGGSYAKDMQLRYAFEVGLEAAKPADETLLKAADPAVTAPRHQYFLQGPFCGGAC